MSTAVDVGYASPLAGVKSGSTRAYGWMGVATATAIANMEAMVMRYGPAPSAFLAVPLVGAFFIDIANLGVIQVFLLILGY